LRLNCLEYSILVASSLSTVLRHTSWPRSLSSADIRPRRPTVRHHPIDATTDVPAVVGGAHRVVQCRTDEHLVHEAGRWDNHLTCTASSAPPTSWRDHRANEDNLRAGRLLVAASHPRFLIFTTSIERLTANGDDLAYTGDPSRKMIHQVAGAFAEYEKRAW
jgi:hypothetical protein